MTSGSDKMQKFGIISDFGRSIWKVLHEGACMSPSIFIFSSVTAICSKSIRQLGDLVHCIPVDEC